MNKVKGFKTFVFGALLALLSVLSNADMQVFFAEHMAWIGGITGMFIVILRALTTSPIFMREPVDPIFMKPPGG